MLWGWVFVSLISVCIAASLAEICSQVPSAGGVYVWSAYLAPKGYARPVSWLVGWINVAANICLALSILFGGAQLILAGISIFRDNQWAPESWHVITMFFACVLVAAIVNLFGVKYNYLEALNTASIYWGGASCIIFLIVLLVMAPHRNSGSYVFGGWVNSSGWPDGWSFFVGLLQAGYTLTGYGTVASLCEESRNPRSEVPRAIVGSVLAASLSGLVYIIPVLFVLPSINEVLAAAAGEPIAVVFYNATGGKSGGFGLLFLLLGIFFFAGVGSLTVALRAVWSFSRDGGIPGHTYWSHVNKTFDLPVNAMILTAIIIAALGCIYEGASAAFNAFTGSATILLSLSYAIPICMSLVQRRVKLADAPYSLGAFGWFANIVTFLWILLAITIFSCPTTKSVTPSTMNYAIVVSAFVVVCAAAYWLVGRKTYRGPVGASMDEAGEADLVPELESETESKTNVA